MIDRLQSNSVIFPIPGLPPGQLRRPAAPVRPRRPPLALRGRRHVGQRLPPPPLRRRTRLRHAGKFEIKRKKFYLKDVFLDFKIYVYTYGLKFG